VRAGVGGVSEEHGNSGVAFEAQPGEDIVADVQRK
jgi:hypothetical protein